MAAVKTSVFLASNFGEWRLTRTAVADALRARRTASIEVFDLDVNTANPESPLAHSLACVRRSEFLVLLLGSEYGGTPDHHDHSGKSFAHREYLEAVRPRSGTRILVFKAGSGTADPRLARWVSELETRHTLCYFPDGATAAAMAAEIVVQVQDAIFEMYFGRVNLEEDAESDAAAPITPTTEDAEAAGSAAVLADTEITELEARLPPPAQTPPADSSSPWLRPNTFAAREHLQEAQRAVDMRDLGAAIYHLRQCLALRPLDLMANYRLGQIYLALGRRDRYPRIEECLARAARVARHEQNPIREAASYILGARAAGRFDTPRHALELARRAVDVRPLSIAHLEVARQLAALQRRDESLEEVRKAYLIHAGALRTASRDPALRAIRPGIQNLVEELTGQTRSFAGRMAATEGKLHALSGRTDAAVSPQPGVELQAMVDAARDSVRRQHALVCSLIDAALVARRNAESSTATTLAAMMGTRINAAQRNWESLSAARQAAETTEAQWAARWVAMPDGGKLAGATAFSLAGLAVPFAPFLAGTAALLSSCGLLAVAAALLAFRQAEYNSGKRHRAAAVRAAAAAEQEARAQLTALRREVEELHTAADAAESRAAQALLLFENGTLLSPARLLPFAPIHSAALGALVRLRESAIDSYEAEKGRTIEIIDDLPPRIRPPRSPGFSEPRSGLFLVQALEPGLLKLSRAGAYRGRARAAAAQG